MLACFSGLFFWPDYVAMPLFFLFTLDGFDGIDDGAAEAMLFKGSDAADGSAAR